MSHIVVEMTGIAGEETATSFAGQITCRAMQHGVDAPIVHNSIDRTDGFSVHGSIMLEHDVDKASPALREACARGTTVTDVTISRLRVVNGAPAEADITKLKNAKVAGVALDTPLNTAAGVPADGVIERFFLDYDEIKWEHKVYVNGVATDTISGTWDTETQSTTVTIV